MPFAKVEKQDFERLVRIAGDVMDSITRHFYQYHDLAADYAFRRTGFKNAMGAQIGYMAETDATTTEGMRELQSISMGRTSIGRLAGKSRTLVCRDSMMYLTGTGLLNRGLQ